MNHFDSCNLSLHKLTRRPEFVGTCDLESLEATGHKKIWWPPAANMGFRDFKDVVAFGNNQLWRPLAAKVKVHHSGLPKTNGQLRYMYFILSLTL